MSTKPGQLHWQDAALTWTLAYTVVMRTEPLIRTNPYLRDPKRRRELLGASIQTSTAIEGVVAAAEEALAERIEAPTASRRRNAAASDRSRR